MTKNKLLSILTMYSVICFAQTENNPSYRLPSVKAGIGALLFKGDVGVTNKLNMFNWMKTGYTFSVEQRIANTLGVSISYTKGRLACEDKSLSPFINRNFSAEIQNMGALFFFHFDNDKLISLNSPIGLHVFSGLNFLMHKTYSDLKDGNGNSYYYWSDGSLRDLPEIPANIKNSIILKRDYVFESRIDSNNNSSFSIPLGAGIKIKLTTQVEAAINLQYNLCLTDNIDGIKNGTNDNFWYPHFSLQYNISKPEEKKVENNNSRYDNVDFSKLDNADNDGDGVKDIDDDCLGTPKGVKVDAKGCPYDKDEDGIPDYKDKEPNSKKGAVVDNNGVTIPEDKLVDMMHARDSLAKNREAVFTETPNVVTLQKIDEEIKKNQESGTTIKSKIPVHLQFADKNKDGLITAAEITAAIDKYFDGDSDITAEKINELIDYFFEQ